MEKELRNHIATVLERVTPKTSPKVHDFIQVKSGYKRIENLIINMMISDNISASSCVPYIENMI